MRKSSHTFLRQIYIYIPQINVFTTHLSLSHEARMLSARHIWNHVNQYDGPVFVTGDFNAEKHNEEVG